MTPGLRGQGEVARRPREIQLRTFPSADAEFRTFARDSLERHRSLTPDILQEQIRERYPAAVVRAQEELARRGGEAYVWYAFRYGTVASGPRGHRAVDWGNPGIAWGIIDDERRFVDLNEALAAIVEAPKSEIVGRTIDDFTNPEDPSIREDIAALWRQYLEARWAESTIRFNRLDGRPRQLAYRLVADDPEPGLHRLRVREIEND